MQDILKEHELSPLLLRLTFPCPILPTDYTGHGATVNHRKFTQRWFRYPPLQTKLLLIPAAITLELSLER